MISRYIARYTRIISEFLAPRYVRFPRNRNELQATKNEFNRKFNVPGIVGIVDGIHILLSALPHAIEHQYVNRKGLHSINAQVICDSNMFITSVNARYAGANHDAYVFSNSIIYTHMQNIYHMNPNEWNFLLGNFDIILFSFRSMLNHLFFRGFSIWSHAMAYESFSTKRKHG